ncbi:BOS complex subunit NOMO3 [Lycorma delicatula]|uniref:BOS complex subunit NOMO3 n=1 Tax=Lycorma delicatula TaxID=130591 RepID=UPI003F5141DB
MFLKCFLLILISVLRIPILVQCDEILGCNGFVKSEIEVNFSEIVIKLYTKQGSLKDQTECAPNNGYYFLPLYDKGEYILKVDPPKGWTFEPSEVTLVVDGTTDFCSQGKDINFIFKGFAITGKVVSTGSEHGPGDVKVELIGESDKLLEVNTDKTGGFLFTPVLPGKYIVRTSHPRWKMTKHEANVHVSKGNAIVPLGSLVVTGYEVSGTVTSDNEPITGVMFVLFSHSKTSQEQIQAITGCDKSELTGFSTSGLQLNDGIFNCHVVSDASGKFSFPVVPPGQYTVVPHYKGAQNIKFDVHPQLLQFTVQHSSIQLNTPFQVKGFSVGGRVLWSKGGKPMEGAVILINKKAVTKTGADGSFHLESMRAGNYRLSVQMNDVQFKENEVKVTPKTPFLPDIFPESYKVCGKVKFSSQSGQPQSQSCEVHFTLKDSTNFHSVKVDSASGDYCLFLTPGVYIVMVPVSPEVQRNKGLQFAPLQQEVKVESAPISDINFSQLRATVRGKINCLGNKPCPDLIINLVSKTGQEHLSTPVAKGGEYMIKNVLPGEYQVTLDRALEWCWDHEVSPLIVSSAETKGPTFTQIGISVIFVSSHETKVRYKLLKSEGATGKQDNSKNPSGELLIPSGKSKICVSEMGEYEMEPIGCHGYIVPKLHWKSGPIVLTAISHAYTGHIVTQQPVNDLIINIHSNEEKTQQPKQLGPLKGTQLKNSDIEFTFSIQLAEGEKITLVPTASSVLFSPPTADIVGGSDCTDGVTFGAEKGKLLKGRVLRGPNTPLADAVVSVFDSDGSILNSQITNTDGYYGFGPLNATKEYKLVAEKEGYVLNGPTSSGDFNAHKLAEVIVEVKDKADGSPLQGVLLSLSGGESYRRNSITGPDGKMGFLSLSPNEYFLRPMMKEYRFDPPSKMFKVEEGVTINIVLSGHRVAYSVFGTVTSLSGDAEVGVVVEAVGTSGEHPDCSQLQEESTSEANGVFRIRGLQPQCEYTVRMKQGPGVNEQIRRATPDGLSVKVSREDVRNLRLIVFRLISQTDLTVYISSDTPEHLRSLKAKLYRDEVALHSVRLSDLKATPTFALTSVVITFPPLVPDGRSYSLQLESSLSQATHSYVNHPVHFKANSSFRLVRLSFFPQPRSTDSELSHSSYIVIPLLLITLITYYHRTSVLEYFNYLMQMQSRVNVNTRTHSLDDSGTDTPLIVEPIIGKRKMKPRKT